MFIKIFLVLLITIGPQAYSERFCKDSFRDFFIGEPLRFTLEYIKYMMKHGSDFSIETLQKMTVVREKIQEWGEKTLERNLTEQEVNLLVDIYNIENASDSLKIAMLRKRDMDLKELGFSKREIQILSEREIKLSFTKEVEINIPEKTQEEKELEAQGFSAAYRRGIDEVNEWIAVREQIIKSKADPYLTHIDYFAKKMREHINYIEEGITTSSQLRKLNRLKKYARKADRKKTSYLLSMAKISFGIVYNI